MTPKFPATVENGKLQLNDPESFKTWIATNLQGEVTVTVEKRRKTRSLKQNSYGYGVVLKELSEFTGYTVGEVKEVAKKELGFVRYIQLHDRPPREVTRSSATFSTVEWEEYMRFLRQWGDECGIYIPDPSGL